MFLRLALPVSTRDEAEQGHRVEGCAATPATSGGDVRQAVASGEVGARRIFDGRQAEVSVLHGKE